MYGSSQGLPAETLEARCLLVSSLAGEIVQVGHFFTWGQQPTQVPSTDVAGITYHPGSDRLYLADSEISEFTSPPFDGHNIFVTTRDGQFEGVQYPPDTQPINSEPTGITFNTKDGFFYVSNDDHKTITKYDTNFTPIATVDTRTAVPTALDPEGITSDADGNLYVVDGRDGGRQVLIYDTSAGGMTFVSSFSFADQALDGEGIAYDEASGHLFIVSSPDKAILEYTVDGQFVEGYDIKAFKSLDANGNVDPNGTPIDGPQGLTFAPTTRQDLYPGAMALFIADGMVDNFADGQVFEAIINPNSQTQGVVNVHVSASSDDAMEHGPTGTVDLTSGDLDLGTRIVGLRFTGLTIPQGATITNAYLQFQVDSFADASGPSLGTLTIHGEKSANASTFTAETKNISLRPVTTASVTWNPPLWDTTSESGPDQQSPSLVSIVQEIVNDSNWEAMNALAFIVTGTGKYESESFDGIPAASPLLHIEYTIDTNSPPVAIDNTVSTLPDTAYTFQASDFTFSDVEGDALVSVTITNLNLGGGTLMLGGTPVVSGDTVDAADLTALVYTPPAGASGTSLATFDFAVNDADPGTVTATMTIDVIPAPARETIYRVNAGGIELSESPSWSVDTSANPSPFHNTATSVFSNGHAIDMTHPSIPAGTPEALFQTERYASSTKTPMTWDFPVAPGDYEVRLYFAEIYTGTQAVGARVFDVSIEGVQVLDNYDVFAAAGAWRGIVETFTVTSDGNLDIDFKSVVQKPAIKGIEIIALNGSGGSTNQPPVASANTVTTTEESAYTFQVSDFTFSDAEGDALASVTISNLNLGVGDTLEYTSGGTSTPVSAGATLTAAELATLVYTPAADAFGTSLATFDFIVNDASGPGVVAAKMTINVSGVNDLPVAEASTVSTVEDTAYTFQVSDFLFSDADGDPLVSVTISNVNLGVGDTLEYTSGGTSTPVISGATLTAAELATLVYTPAAGAFGSSRATFDFIVSDASGPGAVSATMTVHVTESNDPPVAIDNTITTMEDIAYTFQVSDFTFSDTEGHALSSVTISNMNLGGGTLLLNGLTVVNGQTVDAADLTSLVYTPAANASGTPLATFDFTVNDAGPGVTAAQMAINVTSVNDLPVALDNTISLAVDTAHTFSVSDFTFSDADGDALVSVTISNITLGGGTLLLNGLTVVEGQTVDAADLASLVYTPPAGATGTPLATFDFTVNDAEAGTAAAQMAIDVTPAPTAQVIYRVNAGGVELPATPGWSIDSASNPSPFHNTATSVYSTTHAIDLSDASVPAGTPEALFQSERYASSTKTPMTWDFAVTPGEYEVRLYFAEIYPGTQAVGARVFDVSIEGVQVLDNYDVFATVGAWKAVVETFTVTSDGNLDIDFTSVVQKPAIKGIEIVKLA